MHAEVAALERKSTTVLFTVCAGTYPVCNITWPRWKQYATLHGYDSLLVRMAYCLLATNDHHAYDLTYFKAVLSNADGKFDSKHMTNIEMRDAMDPRDSRGSVECSPHSSDIISSTVSGWCSS